MYIFTGQNQVLPADDGIDLDKLAGMDLIWIGKEPCLEKVTKNKIEKNIILNF
jgi:hypothetical protein